MKDAEADLRWPPPGLERVQGDLWRAAASGWLAGALLVLPLLLVTTATPEFASFGPLADAWWIGVGLAVLGLAFAVDAFARLVRMSRRAARATESGYDAFLLLCVVSDLRRDMGFLLSGARQFSVLDSEARRVLVVLRVLTPVLQAAAGVWLCLSLSIGLLLAARGWLGPDGLLALTLLPAGGLHLFGLVTLLTEDHRVRRARRVWHEQAWEADLDPDRIRAWRDGAVFADREGDPAGRTPRRLRRLAAAGVAAAVVMALPVLLLLPASAIGPTLARISFPPHEILQRRAAQLEAYRAHRVPTDPSVAPGEAGRLLQNLAYVGSSAPVTEGEVEPPLRIEAAWIPEPVTDNSTGLPPWRWRRELFPSIARLSPEARTYLAAIARHRAQADFSRLARAERLDAAEARWPDPLPAASGLAMLPAPRLSGLRAGGQAHVAAAAHALVEGRVTEAETLVREVLSVGFLLADEGPTLMDNLVGHALIREGGVALESLLAATGRSEEADLLVEARDVAARAAERIRAPRPESVEALVRMLPGIVRDSSTVRGLAWESFALMATLAPCMNLNRVVFGPGAGYERFVEEARVALVRWPSEERLFRLASEGLFASAGAGSGFRPGRLWRMSVRTGEGTCGAMLGRIGAGEG